MKILITENQLDKIVHTYLTKEIGTLHGLDEDSDYGAFRWEDENDEIIFESTQDGFYVNYTLWEKIKNIFSLSNREVKIIMEDWIWIHLHLENVDPMQDYNPDDM